jgi:hypothetical protein
VQREGLKREEEGGIVDGGDWPGKEPYGPSQVNQPVPGPASLSPLGANDVSGQLWKFQSLKPLKLP